MIESGFRNVEIDIDARARSSLVTLLAHSVIDTDLQSRYGARLSGELEYIRTAGLAQYISAVTALVDRARELGIVVGPGRGSAPSSLVLYLLGVTQIDPIAHGLIVERWFSNPVIEIDVDWYRREELLGDLWARRGIHHVAHISTIRHDKESGAVRSRGIHAACVALSSSQIEDLFPVWTAKNGRLVVDADRDAVESAGVTVLTILGMKELASIANTDVPDDDTTTLNYIASGLTDGVFQLSSARMRRVLRYAKPRSLEHLTTLVAAYTSPFLADGTTDELARRMSNDRGTTVDSDVVQSTPTFPEDFLTDLPSVTNVLAGTFGLLLFQEQFIEIVHRITGWNYLVSELYRRRARRNFRLQELQDELIADALERSGLSKEQEAHLRELISRSRHTALKSHVVAYTRVSWMTANRAILNEQFSREHRSSWAYDQNRRGEGL